MKPKTELALGEKLRSVRRHLGLSQENLALDIGSSTAVISRIERGEIEPDGKMLDAIRKALDIEDAPLLPHEREVFESRVWSWYEMAGRRSIDESQAQAGFFSQVYKLPYEIDLTTVCSMLEAQLLLYQLGAEESRDKALEKIAAAKEHLSVLGKEALYLYYNANASYYTNWLADSKNTIKNLLKVKEFAGERLKVSPSLLRNIGTSYTQLNKPVMAIVYMEQAIAEYKGEIATMFWQIIHTDLARAYFFVGQVSIAIQKAGQAMKLTNAINDEVMTAALYRDLAIYNHAAGNYDESIRHTDEAIRRFEKMLQQEAQDSRSRQNPRGAWNAQVHCAALYTKAKCLLEQRKHAEMNEAVKQGRNIADQCAQEDDKQELCTLLDGIERLANLDEQKSVDFIESVTMLLLTKSKSLRMTAELLYFAKKLEAHYKKKGAARKAQTFAVIQRDVYEEMFSEVEWD